jgi:hypothetical protein
MALQHTARPGMDMDIGFNFEPGVATGVESLSNGAGRGLILSFQFRLSPSSVFQINTSGAATGHIGSLAG